jgi:hypothetical protein
MKPAEKTVRGRGSAGGGRGRGGCLRGGGGREAQGAGGWVRGSGAGSGGTRVGMRVGGDGRHKCPLPLWVAGVPPRQLGMRSELKGGWSTYDIESWNGTAEYLANNSKGNFMYGRRYDKHSGNLGCKFDSHFTTTKLAMIFLCTKGYGRGTAATHNVGDGGKRQLYDKWGRTA